MFRDWGVGALVQTGTVAENQECVADASWSHTSRPGVEESAVLQLTQLVAERGVGALVQMGTVAENQECVADASWSHT